MEAADRRRDAPGLGSCLARAAVLGLAVLFIYAPAFRGGWLWDDDAEITANPSLHMGGGLWNIWFSPRTADYFPFKSTLQWVQWQLWSDSVLGYHLVNVGLHVLAALLLWRVLACLGVRCAWFGGLLFAVHPLAVESVAWISEFKNTLSLTFLLLAMLAWLKYDLIFNRKIGEAGENTAEPSLQGGRKGREARHGSWIPTRWHAMLRDLCDLPVQNTNGTTVPSRSSCKKWYFVSLLMFVLAMLSKTTVVMFPVVLLLYAWWRRGRVREKDFWATVPFFVVAAALGWVTIDFQQHRAIAGEVIPIGDAASRIAGAGLAVVFYAWKAVWPARLMPIYPSWRINPPAVWEFWPWVVAGVVGWMLIGGADGPPDACGSVSRESTKDAGRSRLHGAAPRQAGRSTFFARSLVFGLGFFVINLVPVLGFVPMSILRLTRVADHLAYLPLAGLAGLAAAGAGWLLERGGRVGVSSPGGGATGLPRRSAAKTGSSGAQGAAGALLMAAAVGALAVSSRFHAAHFAGPEQLWTYELRLNPDAWAAHNNLGNALFDMGRIPAAEREYAQALRIRPEYPEALNNLANILSETGRFREAAAYYLKALQVKPNYGQAHNGYGNLLFNTGHVQAAIAQFDLATQYDSNYAPAHNNLGNALYQIGRYGEAERQLKEALLLQPRYPEPMNNLGNVYSRTGRLAAAQAQYQEALRIRPEFPEALNNLGNVELMQGNLPAAMASFDRAIALRPNYPEAHYNLGLIFLRTGRNPEAVEQFTLALQFRPSFQQARTKLEQLEKAKPVPHG